MTYEEFRDWVANLPQADYRHEDFGQGPLPVVGQGPLPESFKPDYAEGHCSAPIGGHLSFSCCLPNGHPGPCIGWVRSFLGTLPKGHPGPYIGWTSFEMFYMKDRLSYRSGLRAALTSKPYEP